MDGHSDQLAPLRKRAEAALKQAGNTSPLNIPNIDEVVHELTVYQAELEIQLEDLQQTNRALETVKQQYASLFDFAPVGYLVTNLQGIVTKANLTACKMLGVDRATLQGKAFAEFIMPDFQDIYHLDRRMVLRTGQAQTCEVQLQRADGTVFYAHLNSEQPAVPDETFRTAITDISIIKQAEETLRQSLAHERETTEVQMRVLSVISHEFRTPLTSILTAVDILERYRNKLTDEQKTERHHTIRNFAFYLNDLIQDARFIEQFDRDLRLKPKPFDVLEVTRQMMSDMQNMGNEGQKIVFEVAAQHEVEMVTWDATMFRRIVMNLLNNALNYSDASVYCRLECEDATIRLRITDHGLGISEEDQKHMYELFYRGSNAEFIHGTGMGLFIVQRAVHAHGGTVHCESLVGQGTTFMIELPRHVPTPPA